MFDFAVPNIVILKQETNAGSPSYLRHLPSDHPTAVNPKHLAHETRIGRIAGRYKAESYLMLKSNSSTESTPRRSYHFFKIFLPNLSSTHMRIPPAFLPHVEGQAPARFYLKGPSEFVWGVDLVKKPDGLFFSDGWEAFALDHALAAGDFLLFEYNGSSTFSVMIFDKTACEKEVAFFARPTCDEKVSFSLDERVKEEKKDKSYVGINQPVKRARTLPGTNNGCSEVVMARMWSMQRQAAQALISGRLAPVQTILGTPPIYLTTQLNAQVTLTLCSQIIEQMMFLGKSGTEALYPNDDLSHKRKEMMLLQRQNPLSQRTHVS
ncbi:hypothetical protein M5K25_017184 [Dendrobium thyrsiflorum]|uniref:TF-B3 domain-containing protein n=1 Tax=Dendrobium thyrsiflorum TaxID=117978 RepID=A0ABD0ULT0_DENTH